MVFGEMNSISNKAAQTLHTRENCIGGGGCFMRQGEPRARCTHTQKAQKGWLRRLFPYRPRVQHQHSCYAPMGAARLSYCPAAQQR